MKLRNRRGSVAPTVCLILLLLSIGLNILLIRGGRKFQSDEPPRVVANASQGVYLREIATSIGLNPSQNRPAGDLASDIRIALSEARVDVVHPIHQDVIKNVEEVLGPKDVASIRRLNEFVKSLEGKRLVALPKVR